MAKKLNIPVDGEIGDLYLVKGCNEVNQLDVSCKIGNKKIHVKKIINVND